MSKRSDIHHISVHVSKSTVMLSVPESTTLPDLRAQLVDALAPLAKYLPSEPPQESNNLQLWEDREVEGGDGDQGIRPLEQEDEAGLSIKKLGWPRWKRLFVSFRNPNGEFPEPQPVIPDPTDGDEDE